ncbi:Type I phosphodiesterase / nucleotide pyrophosphatase [Paragonimus heterotremus]|uniref:Type I phosphodiesterase / nucleotide pyrophosphatase n=1 Tax=Paragonimus heterotremus TaxID=100268 RepID=A0A8J4TIK1_9TREM|nr:Type I phosphodiesterase / nucleotide pyrophosphatase [Paragonimus heterotremus]
MFSILIHYVAKCLTTITHTLLFDISFSLLMCAFGAVLTVHPNKLLLISLDGFRHDYLDLAKSMNVNISGFERIWRSGFRAVRVENEFVTRTAPNHFSIVTGLHSESHGIVDNVFFDPDLNDTFVFGNASQSTQSRWFDVLGEPIWVTNERHGYRSCVTSWPGSRAPIKGLLPYHFSPKHNSSIPFKDSINKALTCLQDEHTTLVLLYHHEPDTQGHITGPLSPEVMNVVDSLNGDIEYLLQRLHAVPSLRNSVNVILTSDHGMATVDRKNVIVLQDYLSDDMFVSPGKDIRVLWALWPKQNFTAEDLLHGLKDRHPKLKVLLKTDLPRRLFYTYNVRIAPVIAYAEPGWLVSRSKLSSEYTFPGGEHGYDPEFTDMSPFLLASGPGFCPGNGSHTIPSIKMVDLYPMMCYLLGLQTPGPHNGSLARVAHLLKPQNNNAHSWFSSPWDAFILYLTFALVAVLSVTLIVFGCMTHCFTRTRSIQAMRRARQRKTAKLAIPMTNVSTSNLTHASGDHTHPGEDLQQLLRSLSDEDEVEYLDRNNKFYISDETLLNMLHEPKSRYP